MIKSGIYIVTLNNTDPISVNANDKRVLDKAIKVTKHNCKIGKAKDLSRREKNYFKTFGESNVNFKVLAYTEETDRIEKIILLTMDKYRIKGISGRKNEWLERIAADEVVTIVSNLLKDHGIKLEHDK